MKDNALRIFLLMYCISGALAACDVLIMGPLGIPFTGLDGQPVGPQISVIQERMAEHDMTQRLQEAAGAMTAGDVLGNAIRSVELGLEMTVEMFKLMMGLYVFDILSIFGIPPEITGIVSTVYAILLGRAILGYLPAITAAINTLVNVGHAGVGIGKAGAKLAGGVGGAVGGLVK